MCCCWRCERARFGIDRRWNIPVSLYSERKKKKRNNKHELTQSCYKVDYERHIRVRSIDSVLKGADVAGATDRKCVWECVREHQELREWEFSYGVWRLCSADSAQSRLLAVCSTDTASDKPLTQCGRKRWVYLHLHKYILRYLMKCCTDT